ncbi:hypothetical protein UA08_06223 [Talaromyces atroroseus]|uniref:Uncharacterized protein n=1 Tax=Talaromyces atroroseus TaxID=1441469 RepID=A0A225AU02_TALAT|nr:hypothetical protein UA08_06223 [Talaromyces atroroseus]OKL58416.1 hypothetical protein UA08_06223 [Talaromyces atroroseus]
MDTKKLKKEHSRLGYLNFTALELEEFIGDINQRSSPDAPIVDRVYAHAMSDCINIIEDGVKKMKLLPYKDETKKEWAVFKMTIAERLQWLSSMWDRLSDATKKFKEETDELLSRAEALSAQSNSA